MSSKEFFGYKLLVIKKCMAFLIMKMIYSEKFLEHDNPSHPECAARLTAIIDGLKRAPYDRNDVLYSSFHLSPYYPGTGSIEGDIKPIINRLRKIFNQYWDLG